METRTEIYALAELEGGYFYIVEKKDLKHLDDLKTELEYSDCLYRIGDSGEVGVAEYSEEIMWYPQIKERFVRDLTESDRKAIREAIKEAERKYTEEMEHSDKNNATTDFYTFKRIQHLREIKAKLINLIDTTLGRDVAWRMDNLDDVKDLINHAKDERRVSQIFVESYNYAREQEEEEEVIQEFQEFGTCELDLRFCEECGKVMGEGYYFPSFESEYLEHTPEYMCVECFNKKPEAFKDEWRTYWDEDVEDCYSEWGI